MMNQAELLDQMLGGGLLEFAVTVVRSWVGTCNMLLWDTNSALLLHTADG